jgi:excisionase family DNA binding protein
MAEKLNSNPDPLAGLRQSLEPWLREILRQELGRQKAAPQKLLFSTKEAAEVLGVPLTWLSAAARKGLISSVQAGHYRQFTMADLQAFIEKNRQNENGGNAVVDKQE